VSDPKKVIMTLRVDFLHPRLDPRVYKEAKELVKRGYSVTVLCWTRKDGTYPSKEEYEGINIERIPHSIPPANASRLFKAPPYIRLMQSMSNAVKRHKPDIIHAHDTDTLLESSLAHSSLKVPFIFDSHENYPAMVVQKFPLLAAGTTVLEKLLIPRVDHVVAATAGIQRKFQRMDKEVTLIYNSRPKEDFVKISGEVKEKLRGSLGFTSDDFIIGYAGVMGPTHSTDMLIKAISHVADKRVKLLFIGGPPSEYERVQKLVKDSGKSERVKVLPNVAFEKVMEYYQIMDAGTILYHPSPNYLEGAPNKLFEFMGYGIPMIAHDFPEMRTILNDEKEASLLIDPLDMDAIIKAMETLAEDPALCKKYSRRLKELMKSNYNWELQRDKLYRLYDKFN
jgi:glycosyltransferase involved in cell wall biosynthesis